MDGLILVAGVLTLFFGLAVIAVILGADTRDGFADVIYS